MGQSGSALARRRGARSALFAVWHRLEAGRIVAPMPGGFTSTREDGKPGEISQIFSPELMQPKLFETTYIANARRLAGAHHGPAGVRDLPLDRHWLRKP
jgi:hypothetical protein